MLNELLHTCKNDKVSGPYIFAPARDLPDTIPDATLYLNASKGKPDNRHCGAITVQLSIAHPNETGTIAMSNALQDIQLSGLHHCAAIADSKPMQVMDAAVNTDPEQSIFLVSLWNVVSKLDRLVQIVDKTSKVTDIIH